MESCDSSPDFTRGKGNSDVKKENSPGGSECDEIVSLSSSTNESAVTGLHDPNQDTGIKNRTNQKKALKNFRNLRTFRRRSRSRAVDQISMDMSDDVTPQLKSSLEVSDGMPHYMQATSSSKGKMANSQENHQTSEFCFDNSDQSTRSLQSDVVSPSVISPLTALNIRNVKILIKKASFKPKRSSLEYSQVSGDLHVDRATCSSTLKDSKFAKRVEHVPGENESEKISVMKVCRYHHCSLHGHCDETHDPLPPQKRFLYKRRRSLKKQKSMKLKSKSRPATKGSIDKKRDLQEEQKNSNLQPLVQRESDDLAVSYVNNEGDSSSPHRLRAKMREAPAPNFVDSVTQINTIPRPQVFENAHNGIQESDLVEIAFGETSYPEKSYRESLDQVASYYTQEQGTFCLRCSCINTEPNDSKRAAIVHLPGHQVSDLSIGNVDDQQTTQNGVADISVSSASSISSKLDERISSQNNDTTTSNGRKCHFKASNRPHPSIPDNCDEVTENNSVISSASISPSSESAEATEVIPIEDSESSEVMQVRNPEVNPLVHEEQKPQFSKARHHSMWNLIHLHMAESMVAESVNKPQQYDGSFVLPAKDSSALCSGFSDSDMSIPNNDCETEDIEVRKLFAVKLVREAIEKILLPEVQDQSDDQSTTSDSTREQELFEKNQDEGCLQESSRECKRDMAEGNMKSDPKDAHLDKTDISGQVIVQTDKKVGSKSEKKAPKHWSNLKKWILLQRFIKELDKVRKFNPRSPKHLPLKPHPESEKVNLRPQTVEERKKAEEWMLDYAVRQAVNQLAPTQKRKVALLVKAFETVVVPNEDDSQKFGGITHKVGEFVPKANAAEINSQEKVELKSEIVERDVPNEVDSQKFAGITLKVGESVPKANAAGTNSPEKVELKSERAETALDHKLDGIHEHAGGKMETKIPDHENAQSNNLVLGDNGLSTEDIFSAVRCDIQKLETTVGVESEQEAMPELGGFQEGTKSDGKESEIDNEEHNLRMERQNYIRMWHTIYQHVVSGIAAKVGSQLLDGTDDDEVEDCNELPETRNGDYSPKLDDDLTKENRVSSHLRGAFTKSDAVKLVQEAVNEILLPEVPDDSSDTQSITSDFGPDQEIAESNQHEVGEQYTLKSVNLNQENETRCTEYKGENSVDKEGQKLKSSRTTEPLKFKNWSKLKKLVLLKRSIKALEKVRKINPRPPRQLSPMPDPKQEKVDLKHQMTDERKKAEQWMLDYAVQHIVTKLTPARKQRVAMLVEAFEAVVPLPELSLP